MTLCVFKLLSHSHRPSSHLANMYLPITSHVTLAWPSPLQHLQSLDKNSDFSSQNHLSQAFLSKLSPLPRFLHLLISRSGQQPPKCISSRLPTSSWSPAPEENTPSQQEQPSLPDSHFWVLAQGLTSNHWCFPQEKQEKVLGAYVLIHMLSSRTLQAGEGKDVHR